jgi:hypothetical protein
MIILDHPFVSEFLEKTIIKNKFPVLKNQATRELQLNSEISYVSDKEFVDRVKSEAVPLVYSNSENAIAWITQNLYFTDLPKHISNFKDKVKFRKLIQKMYPDFFFKEVAFDQLDTINVEELPFPLIVKPAVGFFSIGVHVINGSREWKPTIDQLKNEMHTRGRNFPGEVIDSSSFILEEIIPGDEYAVDVYFDKDGTPIVLNILKHLFSSAEDVSDRVYVTSRQIIEEYLSSFHEFLASLGNLSRLKGFPMHIEFRVDKTGNIAPIEVNPMRFAGWCVTDIAWYAFGINVYEYFFQQKRPDWESILKEMNDDTYSIVVADLPPNVPVDQIKSIDYEKFQAHFQDPLELRKIDFRKHGVFAFQFARTSPENIGLLDHILRSDLEEFLIRV